MNRIWSIIPGASALVILVLGIISLSTTFWIQGVRDYQGLWSFCPRGSCRPIPEDDVSDSLRIVRACHVLGCIFLAAAMAASGYLAFGKAGNRIASILDKVLVGAISLAGWFFLASMLVFFLNSKLEDDFYYGYSYVLGWVAFALCLVLSIVTELMVRRGRE